MLTSRELTDLAFGSLVAQRRPSPDYGDAKLGGFVVNPYEAEFRSRNAFSFRAAITATGGGVNPSNVVLFNPNNSRVVIVLNKLLYVVAGNLAVIMFALAVDPALTAAAAGLNQLLGGPAPKGITENADAASPANTGAMYRALGDNPHVIDAIQGGQIVMPPGTGINFQFATAATAYSVTFDWDELPAQ